MTGYDSTTGLLTDLYQLTMAQGYWLHGRADEQAVFHLAFRKHPFGGAHAIACGLEQAVALIERFGYDARQLDYLASLTGNDGRPLFDPRVLDWLGALRPTIDVDAMPEGTVCFAHQPLLRVRGALAQGQLLETPLLTIINFQTLIASKAARICHAAEGEPVIEFGLRRAQGLDGGLSASRAAYVGGCVATSNVAAGAQFGVPVKGTHAHAWVMAFPSEAEAFSAYAQAMPNNCVFLVDTYDTLRGVDRAIAEAIALRERGHELVGIRLDSGDLAQLSKAAREKLDAAGFPNAAIVASNDLDEYEIQALKRAGAAITVWGVGTRLATAHDQCALGGVYKLSALRSDASQPWRRMVKLSDTPIKTSTPGILQVRRYRQAGAPTLDVIYDEELGPPQPGALAHGVHGEASVIVPEHVDASELLIPVLREGQRVAAAEPTVALRERTLAERAAMPASVMRLEQPEHYPVALEARLAELKRTLIESSKSERS
jgi:nicotinate phosphoribosyltransferase